MTERVNGLSCNIALFLEPRNVGLRGGGLSDETFPFLTTLFYGYSFPGLDSRHRPSAGLDRSSPCDTIY